VCFLAIQVVIIRRGIALARTQRDVEAKWLGLTILTLTIAYAVPGITAGTFTRPNVANFLYYALVGAVLALGPRGEAQQAAGDAGRSSCGPP
jgi:uncharacterized membrane protein (DUF441 family)